MSIFARVKDAVLDTLFPIECLGCGKEKEWLCAVCRNKIPIDLQETCAVCKNFSAGGRTCFLCAKDFSLSALVRLTRYDEILVGKILRTVKYRYVEDALKPLLSALAPHIPGRFDLLDIDPRALIFTPVPLHPRRLRERGFNQSSHIAAACAQICGAKWVEMLRRARLRPPQAALDEFDRLQNVQSNFVCKDAAQTVGRFICVVDDVATTGATIDECGKALKAAGAKEVWGLVLAKG